MTIEKLYEYFLESKGISIDTRTSKAGQLFFALKGNHFNANEFAFQAIEKGASYAVVDSDDFKNDKRFIVVENALIALQQLSAYHRSQFRIPVIAIAGSNGKTTTKELTAAVLQKKYNVHFTKGNFNNHIGLPLTLLELDNSHEIAVIEIGANHLGETAFLCSLARPTHGLITNNGKDHLEGYGNLQNARKANGELFDFLQQENGICFVSSLQKDLFKQSENLNRVTYGSSDSDNCRGIVESSYPFLIVDIFSKSAKSLIVKTKLVGEYNLENVLAAVTIGKYFGADENEIKNAVENYSPQNNRSQLKKHGGNVFFVDCYNANPSSMVAAIEDFSKWQAAKKIVILGDMFELGEAAANEHNEIVRLIDNKDFYKKIYVGPLFCTAAKKSDDAVLLNDYKELKSWFENNKPTDAHILLKGSRGMTLEKFFD